MEPITAFLIGTAIGLAAAAVLFWPYIADIFQRKVIPFIKNNLGMQIGDHVAKFFSVLDNVMCLTRRQFRKLWDFFKLVVLKSETTYEKIDSNTMSAKTETFVNNSGKVSKVIIEEEIPYEEVPQDIREKMIIQNKRKAVNNNIDIINYEAQQLEMSLTN